MAGSFLKNKVINDSTIPLLSYQELDILHALRGFCAFYVVVFHAKFILWSGGAEYLKTFPWAAWNLKQYIVFALDMLSSAGYEMVIFFFVLSGFFIRYAQLKRHRTAFRFYLNRIARIYPPYLFSLFLGGLIITYLAHTYPKILTLAPSRELNAGLLGAWQDLHSLSLADLCRSLVFLKPGKEFFGYNGAYWSLLPEALFYLLVPLAFWRVRYYYAISAACYVFGMGTAASHVNAGPLGNFLLLDNGYFALGVGLYDVVAARPNWLEAFRRVRGVWLALGLPILLLLLIGLAGLHFRVLSGALASVLAVLSVSVLLAGRVNRKNILVRIFHEIGIFSFSLYLYHFPLLILSYAGLVAFTGALVNYSRYYWIGVPLVTAGCYLLYYMTERLAIRFFRGT